MKKAATDLDISAREEQVLTQASKGLGDKEIAVRLGISLTTVRTYWERLFVKFDAVNRAQAVGIFVRGTCDEIPPIPEGQVEMETLMQAAVDATVGGIVVLNADRTIAAANEKACALMNCVTGSMHGQPLCDYIPTRYEGFYKVLDAATAEDVENVYTVSTFIRVLGGQDMLANINIRTLDGPEGRHIVLFVQDSVAEIDARRRGRLM